VTLKQKKYQLSANGAPNLKAGISTLKLRVEVKLTILKCPFIAPKGDDNKQPDE
jgi:hypothetical protein